MTKRTLESGAFLRVTTAALMKSRSGATNDTSPPRSGDSPTPTRRQLTHQPRDTTHHDVLIMPAGGVTEADEFFRVPVVKDESSELAGRYEDPPELWNREDSGSRKVASAARPFDHGAEQAKSLKRGPAFFDLADQA